jgi:type IV pilus assembly protein PilX
MSTLQSLVHGRRFAVGRERGIVLLLVLILLVALSGAAIWAAKASISGEQVGNNLRSSASAQELAELALRYCEDGVIKADASFTIVPFPTTAASSPLPVAWQTLSNWKSPSTTFMVVPNAQLQDALGRTPTPAPLCMIEKMRLAPADMQPMQGFLITARGFSPDYGEASTGAITSGTDAWVQSMIRF